MKIPHDNLHRRKRVVILSFLNQPIIGYHRKKQEENIGFFVFGPQVAPYHSFVVEFIFWTHEAPHGLPLAGEEKEENKEAPLLFFFTLSLPTRTEMITYRQRFFFFIPNDTLLFFFHYPQIYSLHLFLWSQIGTATLPHAEPITLL